MRLITRILFLLSIVVFTFSTSTGQKLDFVLGEILVQLPDGQDSRRLAYSLQQDFQTLQTKQLIATPMNVWMVSIDPNIENENHLLAKVQELGFVLSAQRNHITQLRAIPDDERFENQWQYINTGNNGGTANSDLDIDDAWDLTTGGLTAHGDTIVVCIIDDGINPNHPDVVDNLWVNHGEIPKNGIDDDENGYIDDYQGWNIYEESDDLNDDGSHGTPVAGIVGAKGNNTIGVSGVSWDVKLMIVVGGSPESNAIASYGYAYTQRKLYNETNGEKGAFVVATNSSWGIDQGQPEDSPIWCDFYNLLGQEGIISCGATANSNLNVDIEGDLPTGCSSDFLISVTNLGRSDNKVQGAGFGARNIDLGAYGENTYTLTKNNYGPFGGTSAATPHVAGVIGLLYNIDCNDFMDHVKSDPSISALAVRDFVLFGTTGNPSLQSITATNGRLNANLTLLNANSICTSTCSEAYGVHISQLDIFEVSGSYLKAGNTGDMNIRYRIVGESEWIEKDVQSGSFSLDQLNACTEYEYQSRTMCNESFSDFSYTKYFQTEGCCPMPSDFDIQVTDKTAVISWSSIVGANNYTAEFRELGTEEWSTIEISEEDLTIPNIQDCAGYELRVKATCEITERESDFNTITFYGECGNCTKPYCEIDAKNTQDEWIENVTIDGVFSNTSGDDNGRGIFIGQFDIALNTESTYTISLTPGYSAGSFAEYFSVYIDYNQNNELESNERVYNSLQQTSETVSGEFTVPTDAELGVTRMRVIMRFSEPNENSCDNSGWTYGEYEDYCVEILSSGDCLPSVNVISQIDSTTSSLAFDLSSSSTIDNYTIEYRAEGTNDWIEINSDSPSIVIDGLEQCKNYEVTYAATCTDGGIISGATIILKTRCSTATINPTIASFDIYPNPSNLGLTIASPQLSVVSLINIYDTSGRNIYTGLPLSANQLHTIPEAASFPPGVYLIAIHSGEKISTYRWVKI